MNISRKRASASDGDYYDSLDQVLYRATLSKTEFQLEKGVSRVSDIVFLSCTYSCVVWN